MKPPLELHAEVESADGTRHRWAQERRPQNRPQGSSFTTARFDGFKTGGCVLNRPMDADTPDARLRDGLVFVGVDGTVAWEGRISAQPRSSDDSGDRIDVQAVGWMAAAQDEPMPEVVFVDRDTGRWQAPGLIRQGALFTAGFVLTRLNASSVRGGLVFEAGDQDLTAADWAEMAYDAGDGSPKIGRVAYKARRTGTWTTLDGGDLYASDDEDFAAADPYTLTVDNALHLVTLTTPRRRVLLRVNPTGAVTPPAGTSELYEQIAVYGDHDLDLYDTLDGDAQGVRGSDVIRWIVANYCPKLNARGVVDTAGAIAHLVTPDGRRPYDAFKDVNARYVRGLEVWEDRTLHFAPVDLTRTDWQVRTTDPGVTTRLQGETAENLRNGIVVSFEDPLGNQRRLSPDDYPDQLLDPYADNEATRHGDRAWDHLQLSFRCAADDALELARLRLGILNTPAYPGTITVKGHIRDGAGNWQQGWKVRCGQTISIANGSNPRPRLIQETAWDDETKTLTITTDAPADKSEAVFEWIQGALQARGLS